MSNRSTVDRSSSSSSFESDILSFANKEEDDNNDDDVVVDNFTMLVLQDLEFVEGSLYAVKHNVSELITEVTEERIEIQKLLPLPQGTQGRDLKLKQLKNKLSKLKSKIPFNLINSSWDKPNPNVNRCPREVSSTSTPTHELAMTNNINPDMYYDDDTPGTWCPPTYHQIMSSLESFDEAEQRCLLCFLAFPQNAIVKESIILRWVYACCCHLRTFRPDEDAMNANIEKGFIRRVYKKFSSNVGGYQMHPYVHFTLSCHRWQPEFSTIRDRISLGSNSFDGNEDEDVIYTGSSDQFSAVRGLEVLHLGRWRKSTTQHFEVTDQELFFKGISKLKDLRYLSLRGISMIEELPEIITEKLRKLRVLDLKACHNLERIPSNFFHLRHTLTHLDMTECYFLDYIPKAVGGLSRLVVLKGLIVGEDEKNSLTLESLVDQLRLLVKLSIYTSMKMFYLRKRLQNLKEMMYLRSLTITWGRRISPDISRKSIKFLKPRSIEKSDTKELLHAERHAECPYPIEKLDLRGYPETDLYGLLDPICFKNLNKLYIRGGRLSGLGRSWRRSNWNVEILRFKHLHRLNLEWEDLNSVFPKLILVENVDCPKLKGFPCDDNGVWKKNAESNPTTSL